jgi:hypothetical protein
VAAQRAQMQALFCTLAGTFASNSGGKSAETHQQGPCGKPVSRSSSIAQRFSEPQSGQREAVMVDGSMGMGHL